MTRALIVVDVQNDFCEGGSLAVDGGSQVAADIDAAVATWAGSTPGDRDYRHFVATKDHHIDPGHHWARAGETPDFQHSFPVHCEAGTTGEEFHPSLSPGHFDAVFRKGEYDSGYSGFGGSVPDGSSLAQWLRDRGVGEVDVCGLATDFCVRSTVLDALREGFTARVLTDLVAGVAPEGTEAALSEMREQGATVV